MELLYGSFYDRPFGSRFCVKLYVFLSFYLAHRKSPRRSRKSLAKSREKRLRSFSPRPHQRRLLIRPNLEIERMKRPAPQENGPVQEILRQRPIQMMLRGIIHLPKKAVKIPYLFCPLVFVAKGDRQRPLHLLGLQELQRRMANHSTIHKVMSRHWILDRLEIKRNAHGGLQALTHLHRGRIGRTQLLYKARVQIRTEHTEGWANGPLSQLLESDRGWEILGPQNGRGEFHQVFPGIEAILFWKLENGLGLQVPKMTEIKKLNHHTELRETAAHTEAKGTQGACTDTDIFSHGPEKTSLVQDL